MALDELYIYDLNFKKIAIIDNAKSVIWTERFDECGDFEIYMLADTKIMRMLTSSKFACYVTHRDSDMVGLIEKYTVETDEEQNRYVIISGRCAVSLLSRRVIDNQEDFTNKTVPVILNEIIQNNITNSTVAARNITGLQYAESSMSKTPSTITGNYFGKNLYECVIELCRTYGYGIKSVARENNGKTVGINLILYVGTDRKGKVIFSADYDNLLESTYSDSEIEFVNAALVSTSGDIPMALTTTYAGGGTGIRRKEIYVEVKNTKTTDTNILKSYGNQELAKHHYTGIFEAKANSVGTFEYKTHYNLGDTVAVKTGYGFTTYAIVSEITTSLDDTGYHLTPKLKIK